MITPDNLNDNETCSRSLLLASSNNSGRTNYNFSLAKIMQKSIALVVCILIGSFCTTKKPSGQEQALLARTSDMENESGAVRLASGNTLGFSIQKQPETNLCWAAVTASVSKFYDPQSTYSVCNTAGQYFSLPSCCADIGPCNKQAALGKALQITGNIRPPVNKGMPSFDVIKNEITNNHVLCLRVAWRGSDCGDALCGHFIVIYGFHDDQTVDVADPWPDRNPGTLSLTELELFYQNVGQITHYYMTKGPLE